MITVLGWELKYSRQFDFKLQRIQSFIYSSDYNVVTSKSNRITWMRSVSLSRSSSVVAEAASILSGCSSAKLPSLFSPLLFSSSLTAAVTAVMAVAWNVQV